MLKFYQLPGPWDVCSASCYCAKLEAFMRWQNIAYEKIEMMGMKGAPKGKVPFIEDENGKLGDSSLIIDYLLAKHKLAPDAWLTPQQKAQALAFRFLCEESLYWAMTWFRWIEPQGWNIIRDKFFSRLPAVIRPLVEWRVQTYVRKQMHMQGMGRHSRDEIIAIAVADLKALSDFLGTQKYFFGDTMSLLDIVVFSVVSNLLTGPFDNPIVTYARSLSNLVVHTGRVRANCFPREIEKKQADAA